MRFLEPYETYFILRVPFTQNILWRIMDHRIDTLQGPNR